jgi:hypothetical protein
VGEAGRRGFGSGVAWALVAALVGAGSSGVTGVGSAAAIGDLTIEGPAGSACFGRAVAVLPNGNIVIADPCWNDSVGAVRLYDGATRAVISTLTGSAVGDSIGTSIAVLANGNFVVSSWNWRNGSIEGAGAVTWGDKTVGVNGVVSAANSMVGTAVSSYVGSDPIVPLTNGNYVVPVRAWDSPTVSNVGAARWASGSGASSGPFSSANSLIGSRPDDLVGIPARYVSSVVALANGNYVVSSSRWDNGSVVDAGAVTWGNGATGISGVVSAANSLVGTRANDRVGFIDDDLPGVVALTNGNYVVRSPKWDGVAGEDLGAATWGNGATGITGPVTAANSLTGAMPGSGIAQGGLQTAGIVALTNGNYVVSSPGGPNSQGAVTWGNGAIGTKGVVGAGNSLIGSTIGDQVGLLGITALRNGNYVVNSPLWANGQAGDAGAVTWASGAGPTAKAVSASNSLVGNNGNMRVGLGGVIALANGNYVVGSPGWFVGEMAMLGASTWGNGAGGTVGPVTSSNSLVGNTINDGVGGAAVALTNGNYVVASVGWDNGGTPNVGAVTWGNGNGGTVGKVSSANSLIGTIEGDGVGGGVGSDAGPVALTNGNYVVATPTWGSSPDGPIGAVTWMDGSRASSGRISAANSVLGDVGQVAGQAVAVPDGSAVVVTNRRRASSYWLTPVIGTGPTTGSPTQANSLQGPGQPGNVLLYDGVHRRLLVRQEEANRVVFLPLGAKPANTAPTISVAAGGVCGGGGLSATANVTVADAEGAAVVVSVTSSNSSLVPLTKVKLSGSGANRTIKVTPIAGKSGAATLTLTATDGAASAQTVITVVVGTDAGNTLDGTAGADLILGLAGDDTLRGADGNDVLCGGKGVDVLTGGNGADFFSGGGGKDRATDLTTNQGDTQDATLP